MSMQIGCGDEGWAKKRGLSGFGHEGKNSGFRVLKIEL